MTVIVQKGLMKTGSIVIYGQTSIKIKHMHDDQGKALEVARPGDAVQIIGIPIVPAAGDFVY